MPEKFELPTSLGWYRDAANWIVGLSTAALAGAYTARRDVPASPGWVFNVFVIAAAAFLLAVISGILFYLWITSYANHLEKAAELEAKETITTAEPAKGNLKKEIAAVEAGAEQGKRWYRFFWTTLEVFFFGGAAGFAIVGSQMLRGNAPEPVKSWEIVTVPCCPGVRCTIPQPHVLKIERSTGETYYLAADSGRGPVWRPLPTGGGGTIGPP